MLKYLRIVLGLIPHLGKAYHFVNSYNRHPERFPIEERYAKVHRLVVKLFDHFKIDLEVEGMENIPADTNCLFAPNHQSLLDPVIMLYLFEKPITFVGKTELKKMPYVPKVIKAIDGILMDRDNLRQEIKSIRHIGESLEEGRLSWFIFPEGTRTKDPKLALSEYKAGSLKPAYTAEKPIVPVAIAGTAPILDKRSHQKRYQVHIRFLRPHLPAEFSSTPTTEMAKMIQTETAEALFVDDKK